MGEDGDLVVCIMSEEMSPRQKFEGARITHESFHWPALGVRHFPRPALTFMVPLSMRKMRPVQKTRNTELATLGVAFPFISALLADVNPGPWICATFEISRCKVILAQW
jgi:hypothetical protein